VIFLLLDFLVLLFGFAFLVKGADFLVDGASSIAKKFNVSALVIGLTIVAFGTSMPELIVNVFANINGNAGIAIGNVLGSNIANVLLILGISAFLFPLKVANSTVWKEIPLSFLAVIVLGFVANDALINGSPFSVISKGDGFVLLSFFAIFLYYTFGIARDNNSATSNVKEFSLGVSAFFIVLGIAALALGGKFVVDSAIVIATSFGVSETLIGLTVVAIGTSLPELFTSAIAALKKNSDIAVGNIIGSNIFNIFFILGISSLLNDIPFSASSNADLLMVGFTTFLLFGFLFVRKRFVLEKWHGLVFLLIYAEYLFLLILRG